MTLPLSYGSFFSQRVDRFLLVPNRDPGTGPVPFPRLCVSRRTPPTVESPSVRGTPVRTGGPNRRSRWVGPVECRRHLQTDQGVELQERFHTDSEQDLRTSLDSTALPPSRTDPAHALSRSLSLSKKGPRGRNPPGRNVRQNHCLSRDF